MRILHTLIPFLFLIGFQTVQADTVVLKNGNYQIKAAGPTTSIREEPYQGEIIRRYGVRAVIGKGGNRWFRASASRRSSSTSGSITIKRWKFPSPT